MSFPGVPAGDSRLGERAQRMSLRLMNKSKAQPAQPSTNGNLVKCEYHLSVHADLSGCTCCTAIP
jgi:hypothetical protein